MKNKELLENYVDLLEEEVNSHCNASDVEGWIEEFKTCINNDSEENENEAFLDALNTFEDILDSKILPFNQN